MTQNSGRLYRDLRVRDLEEEIHLRIERMQAMHKVRTGEDLDKSDMVKVLLDKATKHIKLPKLYENA